MVQVEAQEDLKDVKHELNAEFTRKLEELKADFAVKIKAQEAKSGICQYIGVTLITIVTFFHGERL